MKKNLTVLVLILGLILVGLGAFLKITHFSIGPITGNIALTVGMIAEFFAIIALLITVLFKPKQRGCN